MNTVNQYSYIKAVIIACHFTVSTGDAINYLLSLGWEKTTQNTLHGDTKVFMKTALENLFASK